MSDQSLRVRALLDTQFVAIAVVLVVVSLAGGWLAYSTHVDPGTESVERTASSWGTESEFEHRAVVTAENPLYPVESTLSNRSTYFSGVSPRFEGEYRFSYDASDGGEPAGDVELAGVMRGVDEARNSENVTVVWERTRPLASTTRESLAPGETVAVSFSMNATALANETGNVEEALGGPSDETQLFLRATVASSGPVNGERVERTTTHRLPLVFDGGKYRVEDAGPKTESFERTVTVTRERSYGPVRAVGGPLLFLLGAGGLGGLVLARRRDALALSQRERERLDYLDDREAFDEWISIIELPPEAFELPEADAGSLGALVDYAIDTDNGVVESPGGDAYYVVHDGYLYAYRPPERSTLGDGEVVDPSLDDVADAEDSVDSDVDVSGVSTRGSDDDDGDGLHSGVSSDVAED